MIKIEYRALISCPECEVRTEDEMADDACQYFWECPACGAVIRPLEGDCCVFCSFADVPCPSIQAAGSEG